MNKLLIVAVLLLISCSTKKTSEKEADAGHYVSHDVEVTSGENNANVDAGTSNGDIASETFDREFIYEDTINHVVQQLGVNWVSNDSIEFLLTADNDLCTYKLLGIAVNKYPDGDPEVDEDPAGLAYPAIEYVVVEGGQLYSIHIEMTERSMAKISYEYATPRDECDPEAEVLMKAVAG